MNITSLASVTAITVICLLIGQGAKLSTAIKNEAIPVIVGVCGGILGVIGMYVMPDFPANDILNAIAIGVVSGLSATGVNQVYKQAKK